VLFASKQGNQYNLGPFGGSSIIARPCVQKKRQHQTKATSIEISFPNLFFCMPLPDLSEHFL
jgi:hypothetical protein